jgi:hypothetical protein
MGALINIFKRLFGGIFGFIGGLIGGKKAIEGATVEGKVEAEKSVKAPKAKKPKKGKDGFYAVADESMMEELPAANAIVSTTDAVTTDAKGKKVKAVPAKAVAKVAAPMSSEDLIIAALKLNQAPGAVSAEVQAPAPTAGFATQYLVPTLTSGRRSPGPSLKGFKAMAKEIRG